MKDWLHTLELTVLVMTLVMTLSGIIRENQDWKVNKQNMDLCLLVEFWSKFLMFLFLNCVWIVNYCLFGLCSVFRSSVFLITNDKLLQKNIRKLSQCIICFAAGAELQGDLGVAAKGPPPPHFCQWCNVSLLT